MDLRVLKYFLEVAKEENISRAAKKLHVSQPAMSKQLKQLESELGKKLFKRKSFSVELTAEGMLLRRRAEDLIEMELKIKMEFETMDDNVAGDIFIGCAESDSMKYFVRAAKNLQEIYPKICCHLYSGNYEDVYYRLDNGFLDFYITMQSVDVSKYDYLMLPEPDVWGILMRKDDSLSEKKYITREDLKNLPLIVSREGMREEYPKWFREEFKKFNIKATFNLVYNAAIMVKEGFGYMVTIDKLANTSDTGDLCFRPLYPELKSELRFVWKKYQIFSTPAKILLQKMQDLYS